MESGTTGPVRTVGTRLRRTTSTWRRNLGVELALLTLFTQRGDTLAGTKIRALYDNSSVTGGWERRRNKNAAVNEVLIRIGQLCSLHRVQVVLDWTASDQNRADKISRGKMPDGKDVYVTAKSDRLGLVYPVGMDQILILSP